jgi:cytochrome c biogenesis protein CcdA
VLVVVFGLQVARLKLSIDRWIIAAMLAALITFLLDAGLVRFALNLDPVVPKAADGLVMAGVVILATEVTVSIQMGLAVLIGILNLIARLVGAQGIDLSYALKFAAESILLPAVALFAARTDWFYYEKRAEVKLAEKRTYLTSAVMGVVFAAGWTPCVGPILAAILLLAAQSATVGLGALLLLVYSLGLGIPFLTMGLAFDALSGALRRLSRSMGIVSLVSGVFLVLLGLAMFTDTLRLLSHFGAFFNLGNF